MSTKTTPAAEPEPHYFGVRDVLRIVEAMGGRVTDGDVTELHKFQTLAIAVDRITGDAARAFHSAGYSWAEIGRALGITKQAAQQRFGGAR